MWYIIWIVGLICTILVTVGIVTRFENSNKFKDDDQI